MLSIIERPFQDAGVSKQPIRCLERKKNAKSHGCDQSSWFQKCSYLQVF